jgi:mRNA interferase MazF
VVLQGLAPKPSKRGNEMPSDEDRPPRHPPRLVSAPKIRQMFWCDFPKDAQLPEFWKLRPIIVLSYRNTLHGSVTVVPCTTKPQPDNRWALSLATSIDGRPAWAVCDKLTTVAVSRLTPAKGGMVRMPEQEFDSVMRLVLEWLPSPAAP